MEEPLPENIHDIMKLTNGDDEADEGHCHRNPNNPMENISLEPAALDLLEAEECDVGRGEEGGGRGEAEKDHDRHDGRC